MRKEGREESNWTNRKRWSPRNQGTYGFGSDSNDAADVPAPREEEPRERWHNREFYGQSTTGYTTMVDAGLPEERLRSPRHHVSPSSHARWDRPMSDAPSRHGFSRPFDGSTSEAHRGPHVGKGPKNYRRADERIFEEVCERLLQHGAVDASNIEVRVEKGEVFLTGSVPDRQTKRLAEDVIEGIAGVEDIQNDLKIG